jgi:hypothetical protein
MRYSTIEKTIRSQIETATVQKRFTALSVNERMSSAMRWSALSTSE